MYASKRTTGERTRNASTMYHRGFACGQIPAPFIGGLNPSGTGYGDGNPDRLIVIVVDQVSADRTPAGA